MRNLSRCKSHRREYICHKKSNQGNEYLKSSKHPQRQEKQKRIAMVAGRIDDMIYVLHELALSIYQAFQNEEPSRETNETGVRISPFYMQISSAIVTSI